MSHSPIWHLQRSQFRSPLTKTTPSIPHPFGPVRPTCLQEQPYFDPRRRGMPRDRREASSKVRAEKASRATSIVRQTTPTPEPSGRRQRGPSHRT
eukprot:1395795-Prymnesium_polylepis.1